MSRLGLGAHQTATRIGARAAGLRATPAVRNLLSEPITLGRADNAGDRARIQDGTYDLQVGLGLSADHSPRCAALVRAVQIQPDAARKHLRIGFGAASVGAGCTGLLAIEAGLDAS